MGAARIVTENLVCGKRFDAAAQNIFVKNFRDPQSASRAPT
jgi:hypothetical protein